jgi:hypothetical protein
LSRVYLNGFTGGGQVGVFDHYRNIEIERTAVAGTCRPAVFLFLRADPLHFSRDDLFVFLKRDAGGIGTLNFRNVLLDVPRHRNKPDGWLKKHYFTRIGMRSVFYATTINRQGQKERLRLFKVSDLPIKRHEKIRGAATPYEPEWSDYFKRRATKRMAQRVAGRRFLSLCPITRRT